jgi:hypothetical protein
MVLSVKYMVTHISVSLVNVFFVCAYGSLPDAGYWWCLRLGVGAFELAA